ncbi:hypothetical protein [Mucilaginibacter sp. UR6-11]|uniref:hypothetical protein n=1 Tax=Mucilaginibacter sp. UR6-11 TaxID=1435644 RepID=UPI001E58AEC8|nr:hypothetical protein [Mucilaginibacter sp. UR6-11]MCC8425217.1 hypothetical protein [Mucilaginibacter sp. UR6-11]
MASNFLKHKWQKITLITTGIFLALLFIVAFFVNLYWSPILSAKVKSAVLNGTDSLYTVDFSAAELHILEGRIIIYNIDLKVDSAVYNRRKAQHLAPNNLTTLHVKRLVLSHIHPLKLYFDHILDIDRITLTSPDVKMSHQLNHLKDTVNKDNRTLWQKISRSLKYIHVGDIFLNDVKLKYDDYSGKTLAVSELREMNIQANELLIDSLTQTDTSRTLYCKDIVADLNNYKGTLPNGLYTYTVNRLKFSTHTAQINIFGFSLIPTPGFFSKTDQGRYTIKLDSIQLNKFDFLTYNKYHSVSASSLIFSHGSLDIFGNPNPHTNNKDRIKSFPHVALGLIGTDIKIDTILARKIDISYGEHNKKSGQSGTITFNNTHGELLNITTNKSALQKNNIAKAHITSHFMDSGKLDTYFTFNLTAGDAAYSYKGQLGPMDMGVINPATMPLALVKITSGTLKQFDFDFEANRNASKGKVIILYNDLKVNILKADSVNASLNNKLVASMFANVFILKHNNPDQAGEIPRSFNVNYNRPVNSPFFKTIWQTLLLGIKPAVGYDEKTRKATAARMAKGELNKKNHLLKKARRIQKRAERKLNRKLKKEQKEARKYAELNKR